MTAFNHLLNPLTPFLEEPEALLAPKRHARNPAFCGLDFLQGTDEGTRHMRETKQSLEYYRTCSDKSSWLGKCGHRCRVAGLDPNHNKLKMMNMDDDQSEAVDWGDGDDAPEEAAESITAGAEADAVSLASDDDDDIALKKYHQNTWDDSREPPVSEPASQVHIQEPVVPAPAPQETRDVQDSTSRSTKEILPNLHGLPPKPSSNVYPKVPSSTLVSTSATAMAQRNAVTNGNHTSPEPRKVLPPGWEPRMSRDGKSYFFHPDAGAQWDFPTEAPRPARSNSSREPNKRSDRGRRSRSRERRAGRRSMSPPRAAYRPRSRSVERDTTHRSGRNVSPKREASRVERERNVPRVRSRPSSRERRPSPKPARVVERRSRSPPRVRDSREDSRHGGRQEPSQHHSSSTLLIPETVRHSIVLLRTKLALREVYPLSSFISVFEAVILMGHLFLSQGTDLLFPEREVRKETHIDHLTPRNHPWKLTATSKLYMAS